MAEDVAAAFGGADILVNNAGIHLLTDLGQTTEDQWDRQMDTNVKGAYFAAQALLPQMMDRGGGKIINIGSIVGETAIMRSAVYCASKGALKLMTKSLALDLRPHNIQVNTLSPGCVATDMNARYRVEIEGYAESLQGRFGPGDPWMTPDDMAGHRPLSGILGFRYGHRRQHHGGQRLFRLLTRSARMQSGRHAGATRGRDRDGKAERQGGSGNRRLTRHRCRHFAPLRCGGRARRRRLQGSGRGCGRGRGGYQGRR